MRVVSFILGIVGLYFAWTIFRYVKDQLLNITGASSIVEAKVESISEKGIHYSYNHEDYTGSYLHSKLYSNPKSTISLAFLNRNPSNAHINISVKKAVLNFIKMIIYLSLAFILYESSYEKEIPILSSINIDKITNLFDAFFDNLTWLNAILYVGLFFLLLMLIDVAKSYYYRTKTNVSPHIINEVTETTTTTYSDGRYNSYISNRVYLYQYSLNGNIYTSVNKKLMNSSNAYIDTNHPEDLLCTDVSGWNVAISFILLGIYFWKSGLLTNLIEIIKK